MYHRLAEAAGGDASIGAGLREARLLVSGSAPLAVPDFEAVERISGQRVAERYGLTETLIVTAVAAAGERRPGHVGPPLPGVEVRIVGDEGMGEVAVRGPSLFSGYLNRPEATAAAMRDGWFMTGDMATRAEDGQLRVVGRRSQDLIKTAGYKVGAGEVEQALLAHPGVAEAAVTGEDDPDLGQRIVAWVVPREGGPAPGELEDHVAGLLAPHKRPREVRLLDELPRNAMGKVVKSRLGET
jgi:malonyl-CoA/methylmalonyl-CoA synthetase